MKNIRYTEEELNKLWKEYKRAKSLELRNKLIEAYLPLVKYVADRLAERLPKSVQSDELASVGVNGLIDAIQRFDINRGVKFPTYCVTRVRGAMLDELRAMDWVPRLTRARANKLEDAYIKIEREKGRAPTDTELAKELKMNMKQYDELLYEISSINLIGSQKKPAEKDDNIMGTGVEIMEDKEAESPKYESEKHDLIEYINKHLSQKERYILMMYYFDELTLKEIGAILQLSESRVCQLHSKLISRLRAQLRKKKAEVV